MRNSFPSLMQDIDQICVVFVNTTAKWGVFVDSKRTDERRKAEQKESVVKPSQVLDFLRMTLDTNVSLKTPTTPRCTYE